MAKLYVVGIGPGDEQHLTVQARRALEDAELLCGYTLYLELVRPLFPEKEVFATGMRGELERCRLALETAAAGRSVALICSGDAGVYGMASPILEMAADCPNVEIEIIPGLTAALSGAALLGAPLGHDFCVISLSDLLTPWEMIEKRLISAAEGDFVVCLYNPASRHRPNYLRRACELLLQYKRADTVCGIVRNIGREGENWQILSLEDLRDKQADMFCTVFIGSSQSRSVVGKMLTPRGYSV